MWALSGTDARRQAMLHKFGYQELSIYDAIYGEKHFFLMMCYENLDMYVQIFVT